MRAALIAIAVVVLVTGGLVWWVMREPTSTTGSTDTTRTSPNEPNAGFRRPVAEEEASDAGVGRIAGRVMLDAEHPAIGARVRIFDQRPELNVLECGVCERDVVDCDDAVTVRQVIDGIRANRFRVPTLLAEGTTDETGAFSFEGLPLDARIFASLGDRSFENHIEADGEYELAEPLERQLALSDEKAAPIRNARIFLFEPWEGRLTERTTDAQGMLTVRSIDWDTYVFTEAEGMLPVGSLLSDASQLQLVAPRTLIVHTVMAGQPVEADVAIELHRVDRLLRAKGGVLRIDGLPFDYLRLSARADGLASTELMVELEKPVNEVTLELRRGSRALVTVIAESGDPLEDVDATLSGLDLDLRARAEKGALLELGPAPEGEYTLSVTSEGMATVTRQVDLQPGENTFEIVMRPAAKLTGRVQLADGKPPDHARMTIIEGEANLDITFADETGAFEFSLPYPGTFKVNALSAREGVAEIEVKVPGPPVTLTLSPRGVLEVEVFDVDGKPMEGHLLLRPTSPQQSPAWVSCDEDTKWLGRVAGLEPGKYTLEHEYPQRVPVNREVEIADGKVTRLTIKLEKGLSISGRVIDAAGKAVENATVVMSERGEPVSTDAMGQFERGGLAGGEFEIWAVHPNGAETDKQKLKAPAREVVLAFGVPPWVTGRVVDPEGKPITSFRANLEQVNSPDGRFKVQAPAKTLEVDVDGYAVQYLSTAEGDVGDVVMSRSDWIEGDVVDAEGKPVGGATVMTSFGQNEVVTDARGRFKVEIVFPEETKELIASRGANFGRTPVKLGSPAHIVLRRGTLVLGRVLDASGKGVPTLVTATSKASPRSMEVETDSQGKFQLELGPGVWLFVSRSFRTGRAIEVAGDRMEITLGEDSTSCGVVLTADKPMDSVWVLTRPTGKDEGPWDVSASVGGSFELSLSTAATSIPVRGIPCGKYEIAVSIENMVSTVSVDLRQPGQAVKMPLPLSTVAEPEPEAPKEP